VALAQGPEVEVVHLEARQRWSTDRAASAGTWSMVAARALGAPDLPPMGDDHGHDDGRATGDKDYDNDQDNGDGGRATGQHRRPRADTGRLGDLVSATAGFRDEYYGLVGACVEWDGETGSEPNRLVTVGSIDPLTSDWGQTPRRIGGRSWTRPVVDLDRLEPAIRRWADQRLTAKVVLATQSRVLEPVVDHDGHLVPLTPLISLAAESTDLNRVAAVLLAPPVVAWAWQRWFGAALSVDGLKLAARQVVQLPLPADDVAWDEAASLLGPAADRGPEEAAALAGRVAEAMNRAYGADEAVLAWWRDRSAGRGRR
jgi:hypothetical protein